MIFCYGENTPFQESDFLHTEDGNLYQPPIHHVHQEHWATTGLIVDPATLPGVIYYDRADGIIKIGLTTEIPPNEGPPPLPK